MKRPTRIDFGYRIECRPREVWYTFQLKKGDEHPKLYLENADEELSVIGWLHQWPADEAENGEWKWYNITTASQTLFPRTLFRWILWNKYYIKNNLGDNMPETTEIEFGENKEKMVLTDHPPYANKLVVGEKYPVIGRIKLEDPFEMHMAEVMELNERAIRIKIKEQVIIMPEEMFRGMMEEFYEPSIESDLSL